MPQGLLPHGDAQEALQAGEGHRLNVRTQCSENCGVREGCGGAKHTSITIGCPSPGIQSREVRVRSSHV